MPRFAAGEIVEHLRFACRGVIYGVDPEFAGSDEWYAVVARSRPPRDAPWYHVLVDGADHTTYVAERHLQRAEDFGQIEHPLLGRYFNAFDGRRYGLRHR